MFDTLMKKVAAQFGGREVEMSFRSRRHRRWNVRVLPSVRDVGKTLAFATGNGMPLGEAMTTGHLHAQNATIAEGKGTTLIEAIEALRVKPWVFKVGIFKEPN